MSDTPRTVRLRSGTEIVNGITGETGPTFSEYVLLDDYRKLQRELANAKAELEAYAGDKSLLAMKLGLVTLRDAALEIRRLAHRTDLPDIAEDGGRDHLGGYAPGAWTRFCTAIDEAMK